MSNPTELPDLDLNHLEALARAATPGPWSWWTSNSVLRLTGDDGIDGGVLHAYSHRGHADICCGESDRAFMVAANPAAVLALIALARRAQPEGEAPQAEHVKPWREAFRAQYPNYPQVDLPWETKFNWAEREIAQLRAAPAAQHAESGAREAEALAEGDAPGMNGWPTIDELPAVVAHLAAQSQGAQPTGEFRTCCEHPDRSTCAGRGGYYRLAAKAEAPTHCDPAEGFCAACRDQARAQQTAAPDLKVERFHWSKRGMELDPNGYYVAYSAPGTPEAPKRGAQLLAELLGAPTLYSQVYVAATVDREWSGPAARDAAEAAAKEYGDTPAKTVEGLQSILDEVLRVDGAAQLDGGQGEGEKA